MVAAQSGDTVRVHYTGKLGDDNIFDSSHGRDPLEFTIGSGQLIVGFDTAVLGMQPGETKTVTFAPEEGYGPYQEDMVLTIDQTQFPGEDEPAVGQQFQLRQPDGQAFVVTVVDVSNGEVTLDANHPLAGQKLTFEIELVEILP